MSREVDMTAPKTLLNLFYEFWQARVFKALYVQAAIGFAHSYVVKLGFLDGAAGLKFALTRWRYYKMI